MNDQAFCSECHAPLTASMVEGLCPRCLRSRRIFGSKRRIGWLLALVCGGWTLFWAAATVWLIIQANVEPGGGGEAAGYAVMGVMMTVPGLIVTVAGIALIRSARKSRDAPETENRRTSVPRRASRTLMSALTGGAVAFLIYPIVVGPILILFRSVCRMLGWPDAYRDLTTNETTLAVISLGMTAVGAMLGIIVGRRLGTKTKPQAAVDARREEQDNEP